MSVKTRKSTRQVQVADVVIGGGAPIVVQSMTNTDTADAHATAQQVNELARAGSELVRITVNTAEAAAQVAHIREELARRDCAVPLVGDFHFNGHKLLSRVSRVRRGAGQVPHQPGQRRQGRKRDEQFATHDRNGLPVRQAGAHRRQLGQPRPGTARAPDGRERRAARSRWRADAVMREALVVSALESAAQAEELGPARATGSCCRAR